MNQKPNIHIIQLTMTCKDATYRRHNYNTRQRSTASVYEHIKLHLQDCPCELNASIPHSVGTSSCQSPCLSKSIRLLTLSPGSPLPPIGSLQIYYYVSLCRYSYWLRAGRPRGRSSSPGRVKNFLFSTSSRPALGPIQPPIQWAPGALSPGVKRQGREDDHSPPTSAEVKKMWIYTSTPP
jgi:hypothetical protein